MIGVYTHSVGTSTISWEQGEETYSLVHRLTSSCRAMWHNTSEKPEKITTLQGKGVMQIACGGSFSMALSDNGEVYTWVSVDLSQLTHLHRSSDRTL